MFDCAESNAGIAVIARRTSIPGSFVGRTPLLRQALGVSFSFVLDRTCEWEWYGTKRTAAEVTKDLFHAHARTVTGRRGRLAMESDGGLHVRNVVYFASQRITLEHADFISMFAMTDL